MPIGYYLTTLAAGALVGGSIVYSTASQTGKATAIVVIGGFIYWWLKNKA